MFHGISYLESNPSLRISSWNIYYLSKQVVSSLALNLKGHYCAFSLRELKHIPLNVCSKFHRQRSTTNSN
jgi:hypothetical protein